MNPEIRERTVGIIGGSGVYQMEGLTEAAWRRVETAFGEPSDELLFGKIGEQRVVFLPRHGRGHKLSPTQINYRANVSALKSVGVTDVISVSAVGSLKQHLAPGAFVIVDQFIDRTFAREKTFFSDGVVAHVSMANPVCARLGDALEAAAEVASINAVRGGTYLVMEGPQFSSKAESRLYRSWDCDVIGMTNMPEAKLCREAELCYATVAMVTDFDCWHEGHAHVTAADVVATLTQNASRARALLHVLAPRLHAHAGRCPHGCDRALDHALLTAPEARSPRASARLATVAGRLLSQPLAPPHEHPHRHLKTLIRTVPDFPRRGIQFRDITTLLKDAEGFKATIDALARRCEGRLIDKVAGIEARGFVLGAALAYRLSAGFIPIRKKGKLPGETFSEEYALEYGSDAVELHVDAVRPGENVLVVDDLLATGGTAEATIRLLEKAGAHIEEACVVIELPALGGRERLRRAGHGVYSLCEFEGD